MADTRDRGLLEWLKIANEIRPLYVEFQAAKGDLTKTLALVDKAIKVLVAHGVTLEEIASIVTTVGPLVTLVRR